MRPLLVILALLFALTAVFMLAAEGTQQAGALYHLATPSLTPASGATASSTQPPDQAALAADPPTPVRPAATPVPSPAATATQPPVKIDTPTPAPSPTPTTVPTPTPVPVKTTLDPKWDQALKLQNGHLVGIVTADSLNVRSAPKLDAPIVDTAYGRHPVEILEQVTGEGVDGLGVWFKIGENAYITASYVEPFTAAPPESPHDGHWVDINLSNFYLIAYDGSTATHVAIIIVGKEDHATPTGEFQVLRRVQNETMDAATLGVKKSSPDYYYLPNVLWTQYFTDAGHALHTNYWSEPWQYGSTGSHGCINLQEPDAHFLWDFLKAGSSIRIHY